MLKVWCWMLDVGREDRCMNCKRLKLVISIPVRGYTCMDEWMDECMEEWMYELLDAWMDKCMDQ